MVCCLGASFPGVRAVLDTAPEPEKIGTGRRSTLLCREWFNPQGVADRGVGLPVGVTSLALAACRPPASQPRGGSFAPLGPWPTPASPPFAANGRGQPG